ncbi:MAG TPA: VOC family protein [Acidimicrobiia bacterium]|nr:VOC family protein [Acidimicrobiia bacterium]
MSETAHSETDEHDRPYWRGINHLAMVTADMDATVRFYDGVLGMRLVVTTMAGPMRHYFFELGPENTIAFFEWADAPRFEKPAGIPDAAAGQFDHLSFNVADEEALLSLRKRLLAAGCEITDIVDHGFIHSVYFHDNNGIALEASCWLTDGTGRPADYGDPALFSDPDPVPAVDELRRHGRVETTPHTRLASGRLERL